MSQGFNHPEAVVALLVVDDGNRHRANQQKLLHPDIQQVGIGCIPDRQLALCVMTLATRYQDHATNGHGTVVHQADPSDPFTEPLSPDRLAELAADIVDETNQLRRDPSGYARKLEALRDYYDGNVVRIPGQPAVEVTEGLPALVEAINVLKETDPVPTLRQFLALAQGATDHARDIGMAGDVGHYGSDGSAPLNRATRYHAFPAGSLIGETISFGPPTSAEWHVIQLVIDDGVPNRGHRQALLNGEYRFTGVACEPHAVFRIVCVSVYASDRES
jgi:uncharacterized protein YkwD